MSPGKILVVDDDPQLLRLIELQLTAFNYQVVTAQDGEAALDMCQKENPDLVILDVSLPKLDGLSVCRELRQQGMVPILMLSSHKEDYDKIVGLELGADDYLAKPCNPKELLARVKALLRRVRAQISLAETSAKPLEVGPLKLDSLSHQAWENENRLPLTPIEFSLLESLMRCIGQTRSRTELLHSIWGHDFVGSIRTVDTHVKNLRRKLQCTDPEIQSVRGVGFKLTFSDSARE